MSHPRDALHAELATLRDENDLLKAENRLLKGERDAFSWGEKLLLSPQQSRLLTKLYQGSPGIVTNEQLHTAIARDIEADTTLNHLKVVLCKVRQKLKPLGIAISVHWGRGYSISAEDKAKLKAMVAG